MVKNLPANAGDRFSPWVRKIPWRKKWLPTPVFLPGESHGQRSLVGYSPRGHKRLRHDLATKQQQQMLVFALGKIMNLDRHACSRREIIHSLFSKLKREHKKLTLLFPKKCSGPFSTEPEFSRSHCSLVKK